MRLSTKIKLYITWRSIARWIWIPILIVTPFAAPIISTYVAMYFPALTQTLQDPIAASLIGAVIGGIIAFYGSVYVQRTQIKALAAIHRRDEIYIPIYEELLALRKSLLDRPCPYDFNWNKRDTNPYLPGFTLWLSFKENSKNLHMPKALANALDGFIKAIHTYASAWKVASQDPNVDKTIRDIIVMFSEDRNIHRVDLKYHYLPCNANLTHIFELLKSDLGIPDKEGRLQQIMSDDEIDLVAHTILKECSKIESVQKLQKSRQILDILLDELITSIEDVIRFINERFEQHERWF